MLPREADRVTASRENCLFGSGFQEALVGEWASETGREGHEGRVC